MYRVLDGRQARFTLRLQKNVQQGYRDWFQPTVEGEKLFCTRGENPPGKEDFSTNSFNKYLRSVSTPRSTVLCPGDTTAARTWLEHFLGLGGIMGRNLEKASISPAKKVKPKKSAL